MGAKYRLTPDAEKDLNESFDWYESQQSGVGDEFLNKVNGTLQEISEKPTKYSVYYKDVRNFTLSSDRLLLNCRNYGEERHTKRIINF